MLSYTGIWNPRGNSVPLGRIGGRPAVYESGQSSAPEARMSDIKEELRMDALKTIAQDSMKETTPEFSIGDTIRVDVKIREGERERIQAFEGTVIAKRGSGVAETFTVRRVSYGVGVERVFPLHSPNVAGVKVIRYGKVRRSKLYYLRDRVGKAAKVKEQIR